MNAYDEPMAVYWWWTNEFGIIDIAIMPLSLFSTSIKCFLGSLTFHFMSIYKIGPRTIAIEDVQQKGCIHYLNVTPVGIQLCLDQTSSILQVQANEV